MSRGKKILIAGSGGQLGWELQRAVPAGWTVFAGDSDVLDITNEAAVAEVVAREKPDWIINAAAYTAVDKAESELEIARQVNASGAAHLAAAAKKSGARLVHISTDFVFDGTQSTPYQANDPVAPIGVYGLTKLEGEQAVQKVLGDDALIIRTAWVYSAHGNNFVKTMLRLMADRDTL
ncbi:unnamed protein product, partial [Cyprideis torosa]